MQSELFKQISGKNHQEILQWLFDNPVQVEKQYSGAYELGFQRVYFLICKTTWLVKIGSTSNIHNRIAQHCNASSVPLRFVAYMNRELRVEREIHDQFTGLRSHSEWFRANGHLLELILQARSDPGPTIPGIVK